MEKYVVTNLPIKPRKTTIVGMLCTPIVIELLGNLLNAKTCLNYNILNSFDDKKVLLGIFKNDLNKHGYTFDNEIEDTYWQEKLVPHFDFMYNNGYIKEEDEVIASCECLRVEILKDKISELYNTKIIEEREDGLYCKFCGKKIEFTNKKVLTFYLDENADDTLNIIPSRLKNVVNHFSKQFKGSKLLISKQRQTGYTYKIGDKVYNIDIDFILYQTPRTVDAENKIIVNCERQLCQLYLTNYVNNIMGFKKNIFVAHPYIQDDLKELDKILENDNNAIKKLTILFNFIWSNPKCVYNNVIYQKLCNFAPEKVQDIFDNLPKLKEFSLDNLNRAEHDLINLCNMSNNVSAYKLRQKNN